MPATLSIEHFNGTFTEIELGGTANAYLRVKDEGLMIRWEGVRGNRTVFPWAAIKCYTIETEAGRHDRERAAAERLAETIRSRSGSLGGRGDVPVGTDPGLGGAEGDVAGGSR